MLTAMPETSLGEWTRLLGESAADMSPAELLASLPATERERQLDEIDKATKAYLLHYWRFWARPKQIAPGGDWGVWIIRAGRGFGKTRSGAGWVHERAMEEKRWIALVANTPADARDFMIEGPGGILKNTPLHERPEYEPSKRRLTWPNESWATIYSAEKPDQLRGYSGDTAWLDEFAKWTNPRECWDMLQFGMREASTDRPRRLITTTPRPLQILSEIEKLPSTIVVVGHSDENRANLDPTWYADVIEPMKGTRMYRQEVNAEILDDVPGALWSRGQIEALRRPEPDDFTRLVVAIDPAVTSGDDADMTGIIVAGVGIDGHGYILDDLTCRVSPDSWGRRAVNAYRQHGADRIVAEVNQGGDMVEHLIRTVDPNVSFKAVRATRGKRTRAEPVAALYEQGKVHHVKPMPDLEDQMVCYVPDQVDESPDRVDALVWALTDLMLQSSEFRVRSLN